MTQVLEVLHVPASEAYRKDANLVHDLFDAVSKIKGVRALYHGLDAKTKSIIFIQVVWESHDLHQALIADPVAYPVLIAKLETCVGGAGSVSYHIPFRDDDFKQLNAPVAEYAYCTLKEGRTFKELETVLTSLGSSLTSQPLGYTLQTVLERDDVCIFLAGWESVQTLIDAISNKESQTILAQLREVASVDVFHVNMVEYKKPAE